MNQGMTNTIISAIVGGIVGAGVVFFVGGNSNGKMNLSNVELTDLKVANLTITNQATLLNKEGTPEVVLKDGSILAENVVLAKKFVGKQLQGHAIVANRVFTTPDDLIATPMDQWRFFAEIGASNDAGGEIVVRSSSGAASVNKPTTGGVLLRAGFDTESKPQIIAIHNGSRSPMQIGYELSEEQNRLLKSPPMAANVPSGAFNSEGTTPINNYTPNSNTIPSVATQPGGTSNR